MSVSPRRFPTPSVAEGPMVTVLLCGDVMTGRGVDQIMPNPGDPCLAEPSVRDARTYVELAETANGPIPRRVAFSYVWGNALGEPEWSAADARLVNLETSVTRSDERWPDKDVHCRMHPENVPCLTAGRIDVCALANNHVLDHGRPGLLETLEIRRRRLARAAPDDAGWLAGTLNRIGEGFGSRFVLADDGALTLHEGGR